MNSLSVRFEIEEVIKTLELNREGLFEVRKDQWKDILRNVEERFLVKAHYTHGLHWGWNRLKEPKFTVRFVDRPFKYIKDLIEDENIWFIVEDLYDKMWLYEGTRDTIFRVIPELCHLNEYFLISKKFQWLLCEDHHEIIHLHGKEIIDRMKTFVEKNTGKIIM
ncbi:hypothetical protein J41TS12_43490 [Paenibacillus antibioticophila]|uniref:Uncharacterized protein n=1 Tax=Paenibacillus antibioticophila TaxID=1274374 RepID=A0A919XXI9_9BACL|nr:DUF6756 family protein [Paenibacillus antibioticophila]GIO39488.1 hypothetical protein J41TS12_43490 [Paenibacillus antibioticophila]